MPRRKSYEIKVTVRIKDGVPYLRHRDPLTGQEFMRLAESTTPSELNRERWRWERELEEEAALAALERKRREQQAEAESAAKLCTWSKFRERFLEEHLLSLSSNAANAFNSALNLFESLTENFPRYVNQITSEHVLSFAAAYRKRGVSETTVASRLTHIRAALEWGRVFGKLIDSVPEFPRTKRAKKGQRVKPAKGRAIREDELPLILAAVPEIYADGGATPETIALSVKVYTRFLTHLWWSGLRLGEALGLTWDARQDAIYVEMKRFSRPMLIIPAEREKGGKDRIYPVAPEYAKLLREEWELSLKTTGRPPQGLVYPLTIRRSKQNENREQVSLETASAKIRDICRSAKVFTHSRGTGKNRKEQAAGAHDFRRSFGDRWARRVKPFVLQQMMRHESIETTQQYYVGLDSEDLAADIYLAYDEFQRIHSPANSPATNKKNDQAFSVGEGIS